MVQGFDLATSWDEMQRAVKLLDDEAVLDDSGIIIPGKQRIRVLSLLFSYLLTKRLEPTFVSMSMVRFVAVQRISGLLGYKRFAGTRMRIILIGKQNLNIFDQVQIQQCITILGNNSMAHPNNGSSVPVATHLDVTCQCKRMLSR